MSEMKNTPDRFDEAENWFSDWEDIVEHKTKQNIKTTKISKKENEDSLRDIWDNMTHNKILIIEVPVREEIK